MNKLYAFYCRAYQAVFRAALPILPYREPIQLDGLSSIVPLLAEKRIASVLLVTDASVRSLGLTSGLEAALKAAGVACAVYDKTVPNPTIANIEEGRALYLTAHAQAIIAVGGGSVMDCAKSHRRARRQAAPRGVQRMRGLLRVLKRTPLLIAVPDHRRNGQRNDPRRRYHRSRRAATNTPSTISALIPDYAVLDPELTRGLPPMLTATTGMDALTHAIEAYIGRSTNRLTRAMSEEAATRIVRSLYTAYTDGGDMQARADMLRAAYCAGVSFTRAPTSAMSTAWPIRSAVNTACRTGWPMRSSCRIFSTHTARPATKSWAGLRVLRASRLQTLPTRKPPKPSSAGFAKQTPKWAFPKPFRRSAPSIFRKWRIMPPRRANPLYPVPVLMDEGRLAQMYLKLMPTKEENA